MSKRLPAAEWTRRADLGRLVEALGPNNARWVGGAVRDTLLGMDVADVDCATPLPPQEVIARLKAAKIRSVPTGIDHGTVTALLDEAPVEITTLRRDVSTDGRRATVEFAGDWKEDASRRDFTINALYTDPKTLEIYDYFGGLEDLVARRVRFIGDPHERIREDHLRILRYFRFQARFGSALDHEAETACTELRGMLKGLSRERVAMEMLNLLGLADPGETVARMYALDVLPVVLPESGETEVEKLTSLMSAEKAARVAPDPLRRLAALLPAKPDIASSVASRLRLSNSQRKRLACAASRAADDGSQPHALAYRVGLACATDRLLLGGFDVSPVQDWTIPAMPLKGGDIVARGIKAGPRVAQILRAVEDRWIEEGFPDRDRAHAILESELGHIGN